MSELAAMDLDGLLDELESARELRRVAEYQDDPAAFRRLCAGAQERIAAATREIATRFPHAKDIFAHGQ